MSEVNTRFQTYNFRQFVSHKEEVIQLKKCFIDLGKRIEIPSEEYTSSDEEFKYFGCHSETESYDSDIHGFQTIVDEFKQRVGKMADKTNDNSGDKRITKTKSKKMTKRKSNTRQRSRGTKTPEPEIKIEVSPPTQESVPECHSLDLLDESLLEDDFHEKNMQFFMSQSLPMTQSSALIQQNGRFSYYHLNDEKNESLKLDQTIDHLLIPLSDLVEDSNCWPLVLKTITEYVFAFRKSTKFSKYLGHKVLSHYNWIEDNSEIDDKELSRIKGLHNQFLDTFMREILLNCYSRDSIMEVIGGSNDETNVWPFVSKLITFLINESIRKSKEFSFAFIHFKHIVEVFTKDFQQFLNDSEDYCVDIQRIEGKQNYRPLICRLIWSQKTPNYLNSVLKHLIFLITKVIIIKEDSLLVEVFKLFEVCAECMRIGSGNIRPYTSLTFDRPTPITELFQQLTHHSMATNEVIEKLMNLSNICWIKVQLCGHFMTLFIVDLKTKYVRERQRRISLKLIIESLTNAKLMPKIVKPTITQRVTNSQTKSSRKRSSLGLVIKNDKNIFGKQWSKKNKFGENALHTTCIKGLSDKLREILESSAEGFGPDPNDIDNAGYTPLCEAAIHSRVDCIQALIEWQSNSNKALDFEAGPKKQTALHDAIENNAIDCVKLIVDGGGLQLLNISRELDNKTPKELIQSEEMQQMIESLTQNTSANTFCPKIKVNGPEESRIFIQIITDLILSYIQTTKIDRFLDNCDTNDGCIERGLWQNTFFEVFQREMSETDISTLSEDLSVLRKLPMIIDNLKSLFSDSDIEVIHDLDLILRDFRLNH